MGSFYKELTSAFDLKVSLKNRPWEPSKYRLSWVVIIQREINFDFSAFFWRNDQPCKMGRILNFHRKTKMQYLVFQYTKLCYLPWRMGVVSLVSVLDQFGSVWVGAEIVVSRSCKFWPTCAEDLNAQFYVKVSLTTFKPGKFSFICCLNFTIPNHLQNIPYSHIDLKLKCTYTQ